jgi:hypothetical protein
MKLFPLLRYAVMQLFKVVHGIADICKISEPFFTKLAITPNIEEGSIGTSEVYYSLDGAG